MSSMGSRCRQVSLASIILVVVLLVLPVLGVAAERVPILQANIQAVSGAVLGTATFTRAPSGSVMIHVSVYGFNPVAGSHRLAIANVGNCCAPNFWCAGSEVVVLPELVFQSNGSAEYTTVTTGVSMEWLRQAQGSSILIHADTNPSSALIGCGVISPANTSQPGPWGPGRPHDDERPAPPHQDVHYGHPQPQPVPVARYRVTASAGLRLRSGPGTGYAVLRVVSLGTMLESFDSEQWASGYLWVRVRYGGAYYWAAKQYLQAY